MPRRKIKVAHRTTSASKPALLLVDVINPLDFPEAGQLLRYLPAMTRRIRRSQGRAGFKKKIKRKLIGVFGGYTQVTQRREGAWQIGGITFRTDSG